jgi:hypothetical protein
MLLRDCLSNWILNVVDPSFSHLGASILAASTTFIHMQEGEFWNALLAEDVPT